MINYFLYCYTVYRYNKVDRDSFRSYIAEASFSSLIKIGPYRTVVGQSLSFSSGFSPVVKALSLTKKKKKIPEKNKYPALVNVCI